MTGAVLFKSEFGKIILTDWVHNTVFNIALWILTRMEDWKITKRNVILKLTVSSLHSRLPVLELQISLFCSNGDLLTKSLYPIYKTEHIYLKVISNIVDTMALTKLLLQRIFQSHMDSSNFFTWQLQMNQTDFSTASVHILFLAISVHFWTFSFSFSCRYRVTIWKMEFLTPLACIWGCLRVVDTALCTFPWDWFQ